MSEQPQPILLALPGNEDLAERLSQTLGWAQAPMLVRRFPDGESYVRIEADLRQTTVAMIASLHDPDARIPTLLFAADLARELGASRLGLVCPYLCYLRQDQRFQPGEALTSRTFARWLSNHFDWLVTVDPHLHRYASLDEIYTLQSRVVSAAPAIADWIAEQVEQPVLIGPDAESEQWIAAVAAVQGLPWRVLHKKRHGDREVSMELPDLAAVRHCQPVLIDDIISSGTTIARASGLLRAAGLAAPVVIGVHGLHDDRARRSMAAAGIVRLVCCNSVPGPEAVIDLAPLLAPAIADLSIRP